MNNICLVKPNGNNCYTEELQKIKAYEPPIWLAILADFYKTNIIIDAEVENYNTQETINKILSYNSDKVVILSSGNHPSAFIQAQEEMNKLKDLLSLHYPLNKIECIDKLPINPIRYKIKWELLDLNKYRCHNWHAITNNNINNPYGVIYTSVSCPMNCHFCTVKNFYYTKQFEQRLIEDIIADFKIMKERNVKNIKIMDELFIFNPNRVELICDEIIKLKYDFNIWAYARIDIMSEKLLQKMRLAGIRWLAYGIESGSEKIRKEVLKGNFTNQKIKDVIKMTKDNDICVIGNFMFGFQDDNLNTMQETLDLALELNCEYVNFYCVSAYPNTPLYEELKTKGIELPTKWSEYSQTSEKFKPLDTKYLKGSEVLNFRDKAFNKYFENRKYLNYIKNKFGIATRNSILEMTNHKINRIHG